jgi:hypothetical protein
MGGYDRDWLLAWLNKEDFAEQLAYAAQAEIIREPTAWNWKEAHDGIQITNPFMNTLARGQAPWEAYEEVLQRVQALYHDSQCVIADAHSGNLMPCVLEGRVQLVMVDGKLGCLTRDIQKGIRMLQRCAWREDIQWHQWFLEQYVVFLENQISESY